MSFIQPVVLAVIKKDNLYLLTKRAQVDSTDDKHFLGKWEVPGGGLEFGESTEGCLHREVKEELGIEVTIQTLIPKIYHRVKAKWQGIFISYLCTMNDEEVQVVLNEECSDYGWFELDAVDNFELLPGVKEILSEAETIVLM